MASRRLLFARQKRAGLSMLDLAAAMPLVNRKMAYPKSGIGRSLNSRRLRSLIHSNHMNESSAPINLRLLGA